MSKNTVNNMRLIINEIKNQLEDVQKDDFKGVKALTHSYETLLEQLNQHHEDFKENKLNEEVVSQKTDMLNILNTLETKSIPKLINFGLYLEVNHLTTSVSRVNSIIPRLEKFIIKLRDIYNPDVFIISTNGREREKLDQELLKNNEDVNYTYNGWKSINITGHKNNYYVRSEFTNRGARYDVVYIDKNMTNEEIKMAMEYVKPEGKFEMF